MCYPPPHICRAPCAHLKRFFVSGRKRIVTTPGDKTKVKSLVCNEIDIYEVEERWPLVKHEPVSCPCEQLVTTHSSVLLTSSPLSQLWRYSTDDIRVGRREGLRDGSSTHWRRLVSLTRVKCERSAYPIVSIAYCICNLSTAVTTFFLVFLRDWDDEGPLTLKTG